MAAVRFPKPVPIFGQKWIPVELTKTDVGLGWMTPKATKTRIIKAVSGKK